ncbi:hypothetical protein DY000_02008189 [Brassica cretica]|uniref:Uncharacterized protein n=1 Tax=Brassica cretica TaxID=69181 RepID=A0ABQ7C8P6_BRACR|nr:hypothetical protein DY000_02008189 [Brassica cretica]
MFDGEAGSVCLKDDASTHTPDVYAAHVAILGALSSGRTSVCIPSGTVLRLPRQDYSRYLFGFLILPLGSWPLSSSYDVFYFCRKSPQA